MQNIFIDKDVVSCFRFHIVLIGDRICNPLMENTHYNKSGFFRFLFFIFNVKGNSYVLVEN